MVNSYVFLHIEDDPLIQSMMRRFFRRNYRNAYVFTVDNVGDAIRFLKNVRPNLVLSDFDLKIGKGDEVLAWIQLHQPDLVHHFVYMSDNEEIKKHKHWIEKPADIETIAWKIEAAL